MCAGAGNLNKLVLEFASVFWCDEDMFGCVRERAEERGRLYMFWNVARVNAAPILVCLLSGDSAHEAERMEDPQPLVEEAMLLLRRLFGADAPSPVRAHLTRWGQDEFARGSYSFVAVGASAKGPLHPLHPKASLHGSACRPPPLTLRVCCVACGVWSDYVALSLPVSDRLFFAGEATNRYYPATVHGALLSGYWAAGRMQDTFCPSAATPRHTASQRTLTALRALT